MNRRQFLRYTIGTATASLGAAAWTVAPVAVFLETRSGDDAAECTRLPPMRPIDFAPRPRETMKQDRKLIVVVFGGGTRSSETIDDPCHRHIPRLWNEMVPRGTLLSHMRIEHRVVHPNCTASIMTGHWEWDDNDWSKPLAHPSLLEIVRKETGQPDTSAWAFVYASILARISESSVPGYGPPVAANVVEPPTISRSAAERMSQLLHEAARRGSVDGELAAARECARLARLNSRLNMSGLRSEPARAFVESEYRVWKGGDGTTSHDAFLTDRAVACMKRFGPDVLVVAFGEIDCAHYGSWSRYVEAIQRTDELTWRLWQATQEMESYRGRTLMLILPDHGRELESADGPGFIHHSDFYTDRGADEGCRRVWMLALGPGVRVGGRVDRPIPTTAVAATALEYLGLKASEGAAASVLTELQSRSAANGQERPPGRRVAMAEKAG
ncbi:MAG TPA: hypothetical protein PKY77_21890 [Phycisphaerae bacterium]|nr:hypothetical protein [Phycisphaerae bacterium]HRY69256.1 hypothetical protein [Phycisphaerae bacterium]HSA26574.1 hypothetical protein [Phycisphaerae bacterium]